MNTARKIIAVCAALVAVGAILYPPWTVRAGLQGYMHHYEIRYSPLWAGPCGPEEWRHGQSATLADNHLMMELLAIFLLGVAGWVIFSDRLSGRTSRLSGRVTRAIARFMSKSAPRAPLSESVPRALRNESGYFLDWVIVDGKNWLKKALPVVCAVLCVAACMIAIVLAASFFKWLFKYQ